MYSRQLLDGNCSIIENGELKMENLGNMKCEACKEGAPTVTPEEIYELMPSIPKWLITEDFYINKLERTFQFSNYKNCIEFTVKVGEIAEEENHHPAILTEWGKVTVSWWSHKIKGLHKNDFIMAAKTDKVYEKLKIEN
jgi:4a-hydroxytetrahydrobiopterin dehydratase